MTHTPAPTNPAQVTDAMVEAAAKELLAHGGFSSIPGNNEPNALIAARAALTAAIGAGGQAVAWQRRKLYEPTEQLWEQCSKDEATGHFERQPGYEYRPLYTHPAPSGQAVAGIVPDGCSGSSLAFSEGVLHVSKDGSGYIAVNEDDWQLEDDRCEGLDGPEGSVHWITRFPPGEMQGLRDFLNGASLSNPPAQPGWRSRAADDVLSERQRQVEAEGWTAEHDDIHGNGEMAKAAASYAIGKPDCGGKILWPWDSQWWKPSGRRRNLIKAGALILAEIERLDRLPAAPKGE